MAYPHRYPQRVRGWSLIELLLGLAVLAAMALAIWWAFAPAQGSAEVKIEQDNLRELATALERSSGLLGSFEGVSAQRVVEEGLAPRRMVQDGRLRSAWGGPVDVAPRSFQAPFDGLVITYQQTPPTLCAQLVAATVRGPADVRVQDQSVFSTQGYDPALATRLCDVQAGARVEFIYRAARGTAATPMAPPVCTPPGPETRTVACPAGESGAITEQRSFSCPDPAGTPQPSTWSVVANTCTPACPPAETQTVTRWQPENPGCPAGQEGERRWEAEESRTRTATYDCSANPATPTWSAWSVWTATGTRRNEVDTCAAPSPGVCGTACPMVGFYRDRDGVCVDVVPVCDPPEALLEEGGCWGTSGGYVDSVSAGSCIYSPFCRWSIDTTGKFYRSRLAGEMPEDWTPIPKHWGANCPATWWP